MIHILENEHIRIAISEKGAELQSFFDKTSGLEIMWEGDPKVWGKKSPVLFPIVGTLKDNTFFYNNQSYPLTRHGFARDMQFSAQKPNSNTIQLTLFSNADTLKIYPFEFEFSLNYTIEENTCYVTYEIKNQGSDPMFFSVGGHPAFKVPLFAGEAYDDYQLLFDTEEDAQRWVISPEGLIENQSVPFLKESSLLPLSKDLFLQDAIVLKNLKSNSVKLISRHNQKGLEFNFVGFPYLGLWAAPGGNFICIEPWCGIADSVNFNQQLSEKEGIVKLAPLESFSRTWSVTTFL